MICKRLTMMGVMMAAVLSIAAPATCAADHDAARDAVRAGESMPLADIVARVGEQYPGRLLDAELVRRGNGPVYLLRWLTPEGQVLKMRVNARTGTVLNVRGAK